MPPVHPIHDDESGRFRHSQEEANSSEQFLPSPEDIPWLSVMTGLRHFLPHHQLPRRVNVEAQAGRLHHPVHGGRRQGDFRDETQSER